MSSARREAATTEPIKPDPLASDSDSVALSITQRADYFPEGKMALTRALAYFLYRKWLIAAATADSGLSIVQICSHLSHTHDAPICHYPSHVSVDDEVYDRYSPQRKVVVVILLSFCAFLAPISSTSVLLAVPEVAAEFGTTGTIINLSNALYLLFMGLSPCFWGPLSQVYGRRWICIITAALFLGCNVGTALSPNLVSFFVFRIFTAFQGTSFLIVGASVLGDIYHPTERATAMGWFLSGTLVGPAFGPFICGIIVTFTSWRAIFWLQSGLAGLATIGATILLPETIHYLKSTELEGLPPRRRLHVLSRMINPWRVVTLFRYPNLLVVSLASSSLVWNMYSLLTPIRYVLNPRFALTSPIQSGLFYLAPGFGYICGTFFGGRWADHTVRVWMARRDGVRVAEDRLRSCVPFLGLAIPACMLLYGWSVQQAVGGAALPIVVMFVQGVAQLFCFPSLNTYCLDVLQHRSAEVIAGNYMVRYVFAALGTAIVLPATQSIGVGWFSTISAAFLAAAALATVAAIRYGKSWRDAVDERIEKKEERGGEGQGEGEATEGEGGNRSIDREERDIGVEQAGRNVSGSDAKGHDQDMDTIPSEEEQVQNVDDVV